MEPQQYPGQAPPPTPPEESDEQLSQPDASAQQYVRNPLAVMQPGEQTICEVKRHPIGMLGTYLTSGVMLVVLAVLAFVVVPHLAGSDNQSKALAAGSLVFLVLAALVLAFVFIANKVYWGNHWIVTSDSITQISQVSLFNRQSSQLSLGNLEDVTVQQRGILQQLFKYGTIRAETAGERSKFVFPFCPNPNYYAQKILAAREVFEQVHHGGKQEPYQPSQPMAFPAQQSPAAPAAPSAPPPQQQPYEPPQTPQDMLGFSSAPQYQVGQTPPVFGDQPPSPPIEPTPQTPAQDAPQSAPGQTPSAFPEPDQPFGGVHTNTEVE
jgi:hypothetical protein